MSASALSGSWLIGGAPLSYLSVSACSPTSPCRTHPQPLLPHPPSPLVSAVQNVPLPWSSSKDFLYGWLGNSPPGAHSLTLPNHPTILLSPARDSAPRVVVSPLAAIHLNPPLTFLNHPPVIVALQLSKLLPIRLTTSPTHLRDEQIANRPSKTHSSPASAASAASSKSPYRKCPGGTQSGPRGYTAPAHLSIGN